MIVNEVFMSLADGVGGWAAYGIDPSIFSNNLVENTLEVFNRNPFENSRNLRSVGTEAVSLTHDKGTSTLVLLALDPEESILHSSNIGDSGYLLMRKL